MPNPTSRETQIERRRQRALEEITKIINRGNHPLFSQFDVTSTSGRTYRVEIRSLDELRNSCTCPDYQTNLIGTCKHIEGVLAHLREEHGNRLPALTRQRPSGTQVYLRFGAEITVEVEQPLPRRPGIRQLLNRYFDPAGILIGSPILTDYPAAIDRWSASIKPCANIWTCCKIEKPSNSRRLGFSIKSSADINPSACCRPSCIPIKKRARCISPLAAARCWPTTWVWARPFRPSPPRRC